MDTHIFEQIKFCFSYFVAIINSIPVSFHFKHPLGEIGNEKQEEGDGAISNSKYKTLLGESSKV